MVCLNTSMEYIPLYDTDKSFNVMPSSFHDVGDVEFQDNWGRVWVDIGLPCGRQSAPRGNDHTDDKDCHLVSSRSARDETVNGEGCQDARRND
ncbi:hypothetical protein Tco_0635127 [Tanacetum coccineum]